MHYTSSAYLNGRQATSNYADHKSSDGEAGSSSLYYFLIAWGSWPYLYSSI